MMASENEQQRQQHVFEQLLQQQQRMLEQHKSEQRQRQQWQQQQQTRQKQQWEQQQQQWQHQEQLLQQLMEYAKQAVELKEYAKQAVEPKKQQPVMSWEEKAPIPVAHYAHAAVKIGKLIYVGNGYDESRQSSYEIHVYNTITDAWNSPISIDHRWFAMTALNDKLLIVGGKSKDKKITDNIFKLDDATDQMEFYAKMKTARSWCTAITYNDIVIIIGGKDVNQKALSSIELFDSGSETWYSCNLPSPHYLLSPVIVNDNLYLVGGVDHHHKTCHKVFVASLDTLSRHELKWNTLKDAPYLCSAPVCVNGTDLLVLGGSTECHHEYSSDIYKLDQDSESWVKIGNLPFVRNLMAAVSMDDGGIVIIGGTKNKGVPVNTVWKGLYNQPQ